MAALAALTACVLPPHSHTTDPILLHALLAEVASLGQPLFSLFSHPARAYPTLFLLQSSISQSLPQLQRSM